MEAIAFLNSLHDTRKIGVTMFVLDEFVVKMSYKFGAIARSLLPILLPLESHLIVRHPPIEESLALIANLPDRI